MSNFAILMNLVRIAGITVLFLVWIWLCIAVITHGGGITLKNIFLIGASGIIIFVPIWKKYFRQENNQNKK